MSSPHSLRVGLLAASRIAVKAILEPIELVDGVEVVAVAARDIDRARAFGQRWNIPRTYGSYEALIHDANVDAVYISTPASLHRPWAVSALAAGKHVLVEKPLAANADDAGAIVDAARQHRDVVCMEAFHWRYHPLNCRMLELVASGVVGELRSVTARFNLPDGAIARGDIRWDRSLGGGATMDLGCYPIHWTRSLVDAAFGRDDSSAALPTVTAAIAVVPTEGIDGRLSAALSWDGEPTGLIESSMIESADSVLYDLRAVGSEGVLYQWNPLMPARDGRIELTRADSADPGHIGVDDVPGGRLSTYYYQLCAFRDAVRGTAPVLTSVESGAQNMAVVDRCYEVAGLQQRPTRH